ncbi:MAG TPA: hypothetical protein VN600_01865 [Gemmatimonadaceae bacterium]|nr:hypothetical protein [Gemmatimonadaceae bacterium]
MLSPRLPTSRRRTASRSAILAAGLALVVGPPVLVAQSMGEMPGMHRAAGPVSATARREIDSVRQAAARYHESAAAAAAGFHPVFGWIPTMGVHWIDRQRMNKDAQLVRTAPSQLMFSKIAGRDSLVGAAYGYFVPVADSTRPILFDGNPPWHEHPDLAPPGETLVMLHVWFVPSPDGPFAGTNPNLPFWALGLAAPDSARMHDAAFSSRVRRASLALAEIADTTAIFGNLESRPDVHAMLAVHRDSIRAILPELSAADGAKDAARWNRATERLADQWDAIYDGYLASARTASGKERMERFIAMLLGKHGE